MSFGEVQDYVKHVIFAILWVCLFLWLNFKYALFGLGDWVSIFVFIPVILFYSLLPDIDHQSSKPRFLLTVLLLLVLLYCLIIGVWKDSTMHLYASIGLVIVLLIVWLMKYIPGCGHRGITHGFIFITLASLPIIYLSWQVAILCWIASASHLLFDLEFKLW